MMISISIKRNICTVLALFLFALSANAQIDSIKVVVTKNYNPKLADAYKKMYNPSFPSVPSVPPEQVYARLDRRINTGLFKPEIDAVKYNKDASGSNASDLKNGFVRLGYGNFNTPLIDAHYMTTTSKNLELGAEFHHLSSKGDIKTDSLTYTDVRFADYRGGITGKYNINKNWTSTAGLEFEQRQRQLYGYDTSFSDIERAQNTGKLGFNAGLKSNFSDLEKWNYGIGLSYMNFSKTAIFNKFDPHENNFRLNGLVTKNFDLNKLLINTSYDFTRFAPNDSLGFNRGIFYLNPSFLLNYDRFKAEIGVNTAYEKLTRDSVIENTIAEFSKYHLYPNLKVTYQIYDRYFVTYAGITGQLQRNSLETLMDRNPYINMRQLDSAGIRPTNERINAFAGVKGILFNKLNYDAMFAYILSDNNIFYLNDLADFRKLLPVYYSDVTTYNVKGELSYQMGEKLTTGLKVNYRGFTSPDSTFNPWMTPNLISSLMARYLAWNKLTLKGDVISYTGMPYLDNKGMVNNLSPFLDINLGADFQISKNFSAFAQANNLASAKYLRYYDYPVYGFNFLGGITLSF